MQHHNAVWSHANTQQESCWQEGKPDQEVCMWKLSICCRTQRGREGFKPRVVQLNGGDSAQFLPFRLTASIRETDSFIHCPLFNNYCINETLNQPTASWCKIFLSYIENWLERKPCSPQSSGRKTGTQICVSLYPFLKHISRFTIQCCLMFSDVFFCHMLQRWLSTVQVEKSLQCLSCTNFDLLIKLLDIYSTTWTLRLWKR